MVWPSSSSGGRASRAMCGRAWHPLPHALSGRRSWCQPPLKDRCSRPPAHRCCRLFCMGASAWCLIEGRFSTIADISVPMNKEADAGMLSASLESGGDKSGTRSFVVAPVSHNTTCGLSEGELGYGRHIGPYQILAVGGTML